MGEAKESTRTASAFGTTERTIARALSRFPVAKAGAKRLWTALNHGLHRERGFVSALGPGVHCDFALGGQSPDDARFVGYFEPTPFSADGTRLLHHRRQRDAAEVEVIVRDEDGTEHVLARTPAWSTQQGARPHWVPGDANAVVHNDVENGALGSRWHALDAKRSTFLPAPLAALAPDGSCFASLDFAALTSIAPDYGYAACTPGPEPRALLLHDRTGKVVAELCDVHRARSLAPARDMDGARHELNHVSFAPDGASLVFIHRWQGPAGRRSRLLRFDLADGSLRVVLDDGMVSHFGWTPDGHLAVYARCRGREAYHLLDPATAAPSLLAPGRLDAFGDGHPSISPDGRWLLTDSYPDRRRQQHLLALDLGTGEVRPLGRFLAPLAFQGIDRVDLHPRFSPDGRRVCIDSAHTGVRGVFVLDVSQALAP